jgi:hypothetical protein
MKASFSVSVIMVSISATLSNRERVFASLEIGIHPVPDVSCFANIKDRSLFVFKEIYTGIGGKIINFLIRRLRVHI